MTCPPRLLDSQDVSVADGLPGVAATIAAGAQVGSYIVIATPEGYLGLAVRDR